MLAGRGLSGSPQEPTEGHLCGFWSLQSWLLLQEVPCFRGVSETLQNQQFSDLGPCWLQVHLDLETGV